MFEEKNWEPEFKERLARCYDEMKWLYGELYSGDMHAFAYFCDMLHQYYSERSEKLREWDRAREVVPDWYAGNEMMGMLMYTNCFAGTLQGVKSHLDYIQECGVNYVHLMPLLESPAGRSDGGYAVADFRKVQPELGTMEDLADLSDECHDRGMSVCLDFVMNHTSEDHEWAKRARAGEKEYQDRYFFFDNWDIPNEFEKTVPQVFPQTAPGNFTWCEEAHKVVMTTFYPYQWDLNYRNPTVFNDMTANMLYLCNHGVDIVRLDAVPYIWKTIGTNCRNLPQVHTLVRIMRMATEVVCPGTLLLGEVVMEPSKVVPYFGTVEKPECQMLYNVTTMASTWHTVATKDVRLLKHQLGIVFALPKQYTFLNYLRCHDDIGWGLDYDFLKQFGIEEVAHKKYLNDYLKGAWYGSDARGELYNDDPKLGDARLCGTTASLCGIEAAEYERNDQKLARAIRLDLMLHAFLFTQSGIPVLYSGDEIGQLNDYTYHDDPLKREDSRYLHRGNLKWEEVAERHDPKTRPGKLFEGITRLGKLRRSFDVFDSQADAWVVETWNDHVLGIGRYYKGQKLIALFNFSEFDQTAWINEQEEYYDMLTGQKRPARAVGIPAYDFAWLLTSFNTAGNPVKEAEEAQERSEQSKKEAVQEKKQAAETAIREEEKKPEEPKREAPAKKPVTKKSAAKKPAGKKPAKEAAPEEAPAAGTEQEKKAAAKADTEKKPVVKADTGKKAVTKADTEKKPVVKADTEKKPVVKADTGKKAVAKADTEKKPVVKADTEKKPVVKADTGKKAVAKADTEKKPVVKADTEKKPVVKADTGKKAVVKADTEKKPAAKAEPQKKADMKQTAAAAATAVVKPAEDE